MTVGGVESAGAELTQGAAKNARLAISAVEGGRMAENGQTVDRGKGAVVAGGGRYWARTSDFHRVKVALYH